MKTTGIVQKIISLAVILIVGIGSTGCTGNVFSSLGDDTEKNLLYLLLAGGSKTSPFRLNEISTADTGTHGIGSTINITLTFDAPVTLDAGATIDVTLNSGAVIHVDSSFGTSDTVNAEYAVQEGDTTGASRLNAIAITVNNGTLRDENGLRVKLSLPDNNLATTSEVYVDGIRPRISSVTSTTANGTYGAGASIDVTVNFTEPVTLAGGNLEVTLDTGVTVNIAPFGPASSASGTYTVVSGHTSADLDVTGIALGAGASLVDDCDELLHPNDMLDFSIPANQDLGDLKDIEIDTTAPTILSVTSTTDNGTYGTGAEVNVQIEFSENVILAGGTLDVTLNSGAVLNVPAFGVPASTVNYTYHVSSGDTTSGADLRVNGIALGGGASLADDCDGNPNPMVDFSVPAGQNLDDLKDIKIDATAPEITELNSTKMNGAYRAGEDIDVTVTFSEDVTLAGGNLVIDLDSGGTVTISSINSSTTASGTYTVGAGENSEDLTVDGVSLSGGATLRDAASNDASLALTYVNTNTENLGDNNNIVIDTTAPYITEINSTKSDGTYGAGTDIDVTLTFSEPVTLAGGGDLEIALDSGGTVTISSISNSTTATGTYTVASGNSSADLTVTGVSLDGATLRDSASNDASLALTYVNTNSENLGHNKAIVIDAVPPTIVSAETLDTSGNGRIDHYKITFSKNVDDTSFPGYNGSSETGDPQSKWLVSGYSGVILVRGSAAPEADTSNDTVIYLAFNEIGSGYDTGVKPDLYTEADPELTDTVANNPNPLAQVGMGAAIEIDGAAPIITAATGVTGTTTLAINFSEVVDGDGSLNDCDQALTTGSFAYLDNHSGDASGISSMIDASACGDRMVTVELDSPLAIEDLNVDEVRVGSTAIYDMADNPAGTAREVAITGAISPYVLGVSASGARKIRITYSEPVDNSGGATGALNHANYTLTEDPVETGCSGGGSGADTVNIDTGTAIVEITAGTVFELTTDADQCSSTIYRLAVDNVIDVDDGLEIVDPKSDTFQGNERLKVSAASALSLTTMVVTFNKDVEEGDGAGGAESEDRYMFTGVTNLGTITGAVRGTGGTANQVTLTHTIEQTGGNYTVIASNGVDGDGFDDASFGAIQIDGGSETLQPSPRDRWLWSGYGEGIEFFVQGPIASDPFGDGSDFGYLASYQGRVYIGPNRKGNASTRMEADGDNPTPIFFSFEKDTSTANSTGTHSNSATTRDGGTAVPPYVSIGHTGCTANNADLATGCGPDNENGRGLFVNGTISGTPYLFITGGRSAGDNDYLYHTTDTGTTLGFDFVDCSATFDDGDSNAISGNRGTESIVVFNSKVYWMEPGDQWYRPYLVKLNNLDPQSEENVDSVWMRIRYMTGIGAHSTTKPNYADRLGGTLFEFNDRLYLANSGSVRDVTGGDWDCPEGEDGDRCSNNGGIVRSTNDDPARCTGADTCSNWTDITPTSAKFTYYFSKILPGLADLIPADRPIPSFASYKGNLYMIRNACTTNMIDRGCDPVGSPCSDDVECPAGNEVPQLWKCVPGVDGHCDAGDWELVAENASTGKTNMGDGNNTHITLLVANGDYLYVGFDNASTGVEIWRTNESDPENEGHFTQIGGNGLGDVDMLEIYSAISISIDTDYYLYVSAGKNATPVSVYRQKNN